MGEELAGTMDWLAGRVLVVAGDDARLADMAGLAMGEGARVAVVSRRLDGATPATVRFNADPRDPDAWERIGMHVEQHLGPVDSVISDEGSREVVDAVFAADLARRGRGPVVVAQPGEQAQSLLIRLTDTPRAVPSRPRPEAPDR